MHTRAPSRYAWCPSTVRFVKQEPKIYCTFAIINRHSSRQHEANSERFQTPQLGQCVRMWVSSQCLSCIYVLCRAQARWNSPNPRKVTPTPKTIHIARQHKVDLNESWTSRWVNTPLNPRPAHHAANNTPPLTPPAEPLRTLNRRPLTRPIH